ncbi:ABC transporter permease [Alteromonadaceae bacterium M269]|nr:ABC transporter permease [Alteromonadaceae bacterium M269]
MFDLLYSFRLLKREKIQIFILAFGFAFFTAFLSFSLELGRYLLQEKPLWVQNENHYMTIGRTDINSDFTTINGHELDVISKIPQVKELSRLAVKNWNGKINGKVFNSLNLVFYQNNLNALLGLPDIFQYRDNGVYISHSFWHKNQSTINLDNNVAIEFSGTSKILKINGILPESMDRLGNTQAEIWLPYEHLSSFSGIPVLPSDSSDNDSTEGNNSLENKLKSLAIFYGVATLNQQFEHNRILDSIKQAELNNTKSEPTNFTYFEAPKQLSVVSGIEFNPSYRAIINQQFWLLLILVIGLGLLNGLNLFTISTSKLIYRQQELNLRLVLGARFSSFFHQISVEHLPLIISTLTLGWLIYAIIPLLISGNSVYAFILNSYDAGHTLLTWISLCALITIFIIICACVPLIKLFKGSHFHRSSHSTLSVRNRLYIHLNRAGQMLIAILGLTIALSLVLEEIERRNSIQFADQLHVIDVQAEQVIPLKSNLLEGELGTLNSSQMAVSISPFVMPDYDTPFLSVEGMEDSDKFVVRNVAVSENYFSLLELEFVTSFTDLGRNDIIINEAVADLLAKDGNVNALIGQDVTLAGVAIRPQTFRVKAVLKNTQHFGIFENNTPVVYTHLGKAWPFLIYQLSFFSLPDYSDALVNTIQSWLLSESIEGVIESQGSISQQLSDLDKRGNLLFWTSLVVTSLIFALVCISLFYQMMGHVKAYQVKFGTMLAIGAKTRHIAWELFKESFYTFGIVNPAVLAVIFALEPLFIKRVGQEIFSLESYLLAAFLVLTLTIMTLLVSLFRLKGKKISVLLQTNG